MRLETIITIVIEPRPVMAAVEKGNFKNLSHAGASMRKDVRGSFPASRRKIYRRVRVKGRRRKRAFYTPSRPGQPPGLASKRLQRAIAYSASKHQVVIGSRYKTAGRVGRAHEEGGVYKKNRYPKRQFITPAFKRAMPRFAGRWRGSLGQ